MRFAELTARSLMSGMAMNVMESDVMTSENPAALLARQSSCAAGQEPCGTGCMFTGSVCCASMGRSTFCDPGYYCMARPGCCPDGEVCTGTGGSSCSPGYVPCVTGCIPSGSVCCPAGGYCEAGYTCTSDRKCRPSSGGGDSGGGGGGGSSTCDAGRVECDSDYCMPSSGTCCNTGLGKYCRSGYYCVTGGCCPDGRTCSGGSDDDDDDDDDDDEETETSTSSRGIIRPTSTTTTSTSTESEDTFPTPTDDDTSGDSTSSDTEDTGNTDDTTNDSPSDSANDIPAPSLPPIGGAGVPPPGDSMGSALAVPGCLALVAAGVMAMLL
ncbi:uncharacterized protein B0H64DRAFT_446592 [Chaetomium fimeti]|uniref:Uncharacterized protein n=1 Tax=Chaetomium fimeti TaxID=1854472 RepID=A0AAE0H9C9_9PEZI|nr:hypothetical protein B0H64DRAFT_446592 [Chaetomium fimeti]